MKISYIARYAPDFQTVLSKKNPAHYLKVISGQFLKSLESMRELGYAYAIIGWPTNSAVSFYKECVGAIMIDENLRVYISE